VIKKLGWFLGMWAVASVASACDSVVGKYANEWGDLEITRLDGRLHFSLLVVSARGRTGEAEGEIAFDDQDGVYKNPQRDCEIQFQFSPPQIALQQIGSCEMGMGVSAAGRYRLSVPPNQQ